LRLLFYLFIVFIFALGVVSSVFCRARWEDTKRVWPILVVAGLPLLDATIGFFTAVVAMLFLARLQMFSDGHFASAYESFARPAGAYVIVIAGTPLLAAMSCWLQKHWNSIARRTWITVVVLLATAATLHLVFVEHGQGVYALSQPPHGAWFAWPGEVFGEEPTAALFWFAPRFGGEGFGSVSCFVLGIVAPIVALAAALVTLLAGGGRSQPPRRPMNSPAGTAREA
jgi:uncharacterized membrane protein YvlD (DUF360 family)